MLLYGGLIPQSDNPRSCLTVPLLTDGATVNQGDEHAAASSRREEMDSIQTLRELVVRLGETEHGWHDDVYAPQCHGEVCDAHRGPASVP